MSRSLRSYRVFRSLTRPRDLRSHSLTDQGTRLMRYARRYPGEESPLEQHLAFIRLAPIPSTPFLTIDERLYIQQIPRLSGVGAGCLAEFQQLGPYKCVQVSASVVRSSSASQSLSLDSTKSSLVRSTAAVWMPMCGIAGHASPRPDKHHEIGLSLAQGSPRGRWRPYRHVGHPSGNSPETFMLGQKQAYPRIRCTDQGRFTYTSRRLLSVRPRGTNHDPNVSLLSHPRPNYSRLMSSPQSPLIITNLDSWPQDSTGEAQMNPRKQRTAGP